MQNCAFLKRFSSFLSSQLSGAGGCTFKKFMDCKPHAYNGSDGAVGLLRWFEKTESVFIRCNCPPASQVTFATGTLEGAALTWWNSQNQTLGAEAANAMSWNEFKTSMTEEYCPRGEVQKLEGELYNLKMVGSEVEAYTARSHELAVLCPQMVNPPYKRIELYIDGLSPQIQGMVTSAEPATIQQAIRLAHKLTDQAVAQGTLPPRGASAKPSDSNNKRKSDNANNQSSSSNSQPQQNQRKFDSNRSFTPNNGNNNNQTQSTYTGKYPKCNKCNYHHNGSCESARCQRCGKMGHAARNCRGELMPKQANQQRGSVRGCYKCGKEDHFRNNCPELNRNGGNPGNNTNNGTGNNNNNENGGGADARAFVIGSGKARNNPNVVTCKFSLNACFAFVLLF